MKLADLEAAASVKAEQKMTVLGPNIPVDIPRKRDDEKPPSGSLSYTLYNGYYIVFSGYTQHWWVETEDGILKTFAEGFADAKRSIDHYVRYAKVEDTLRKVKETSDNVLAGK